MWLDATGAKHNTIPEANAEVHIPEGEWVKFDGCVPY